MKGRRKPFSQESYEKNKWAEEFLLTKINIRKHKVDHNPDIHGIDLLIYDKDDRAIGGIETEVHGKYWDGLKFPFPTCHFLERKTKYIKKNNFYVMLNRDGSNALMLPFRDLKKYPLRQINNTSMSGEYFYDVPIQKCIMGWKNINTRLNKYFGVAKHEKRKYK